MLYFMIIYSLAQHNKIWMLPLELYNVVTLMNFLKKQLNSFYLEESGISPHTQH